MTVWCAIKRLVGYPCQAEDSEAETIHRELEDALVRQRTLALEQLEAAADAQRASRELRHLVRNTLQRLESHERVAAREAEQ